MTSYIVRCFSKRQLAFYHCFGVLCYAHLTSMAMDLSKAREISQLVQAAGGYSVDGWKPVVGEYLYTRESGAVANQFHIPEAIEPYSADIVAANRKIVLGKKSGLSSIVLKLEELGLNAPADKHGDILNEVKIKATAAQRLMTDDEFRAVVAQYA